MIGPGVKRMWESPHNEATQTLHDQVSGHSRGPVHVMAGQVWGRGVRRALYAVADEMAGRTHA